MNIHNINATSNCLSKVSSAKSISCLNETNFDYNKLKNNNNIEHLQIKSAGLKEIPPVLFTMKNLKSLDLSNNSIVNISSEISKLASLKTLNLKNNSITNYYNITKVKSITKLNLSYNNIFVLDSSINNLTSLNSLNIAYNSINAVSDLKLKNLNELLLNDNVLVEINNQSNLKVNKINLKNNYLSINKIKVNNKDIKVTKQATYQVDLNKIKIKRNWYNQNNDIQKAIVTSNNKQLVGYKNYYLSEFKDKQGNTYTINEVYKILSSKKQYELSTNVILKDSLDRKHIIEEINLSSKDGNTYIEDNSNEYNGVSLKDDVVKEKDSSTEKNEISELLKSGINDFTKNTLSFFALNNIVILSLLLASLLFLILLIIILISIKTSQMEGEINKITKNS